MILCLDVDYREKTAMTGCVGFAAWDSETTLVEASYHGASPAEYQPGEFYRRELPLLLDAIKMVNAQPHTIIVDGYVWLGPQEMGLGAHLYHALAGSVPVVGVAKNRFHSAVDAIEVFRGQSQKPLYVTAAGLSTSEAAKAIQSMAGTYRIPDMLKRVDRLARDATP